MLFICYILSYVYLQTKQWNQIQHVREKWPGVWTEHTRSFRSLVIQSFTGLASCGSRVSVCFRYYTCNKFLFCFELMDVFYSCFISKWAVNLFRAKYEWILSLKQSDWTWTEKIIIITAHSRKETNPFILMLSFKVPCCHFFLLQEEDRQLQDGTREKQQNKSAQEMENWLISL